MSTTPPVDQRASVPAIFDEGAFDSEHVPAGHFHFFKEYGAPEDSQDAGLLFGCPCGCGELKSVRFRPHAKRPNWSWDGNREKPTLTPSINILQLDETGKQIGEHWHGWLQNGEFRSV